MKDDQKVIELGYSPATDAAAEFQRLEQIIDDDMKSFEKVGSALMEIRDSRLYRTQYKTFKEYLSAKWEISKAYANRLIASANVMKNLAPFGDILPKYEAQVRPLANLSPSDQQRVWQRAVETASQDHVTGKHVLKCRKELIPDEEQSCAASSDEQSEELPCSSISSDFEDEKPCLSNPSGEPTPDDKANQASADMKALTQKLYEIQIEFDQIRSDSVRRTFEKYRALLVETLKGLSPDNDAGDKDFDLDQQEGGLRNAA